MLLVGWGGVIGPGVISGSTTAVDGIVGAAVPGGVEALGAGGITGGMLRLGITWGDLAELGLALGAGAIWIATEVRAEAAFWAVAVVVSVRMLADEPGVTVIGIVMPEALRSPSLQRPSEAMVQTALALAEAGATVTARLTSRAALPTAATYICALNGAPRCGLVVRTKVWITNVTASVGDTTGVGRAGSDGDALTSATADCCDIADTTSMTVVIESRISRLTAAAILHFISSAPIVAITCFAVSGARGGACVGLDASPTRLFAVWRAS